MTVIAPRKSVFIEYLRLNPPKTGLQTPKTMKLG